MKKYYKEVLKQIDDMGNGDETVLVLERAMKHYCSVYDMCTGYKEALKETIIDQYENHADEQDENDMYELSKMLDSTEQLCPYYLEPVLPDEHGKCSLCGNHEA